MVSPGPRNELLALSKNNGSSGSVTSSLAANAWKLFHIATILVGTHGASNLTSPNAKVSPVGVASANISPSWTAMVSPSTKPKPVIPSTS